MAQQAADMDKGVELDAKIKRAEEELADVFQRRYAGMTDFAKAEVCKVINLWRIYHYDKGPSATPPHIQQFLLDASIDTVNGWLSLQLDYILERSGETLPYLIPAFAECQWVIPILEDNIDEDCWERIDIPFSQVVLGSPDATTEMMYGQPIPSDTRNPSNCSDIQKGVTSSEPSLEKRKSDECPGGSNVPAPGPSFSNGLQEGYAKIEALAAKIDNHFNELKKNQEKDAQSILDTICKHTKAIRKSGRQVQKKVNKIRKSQRAKRKAVMGKSTPALSKSH